LEPKDFEPLEEVSDSETDKDQGRTKRATTTTARRRDMGVDVTPLTSPAKGMTTTPIAAVKNLRKRKKEPVIGGDGKAPKKRKRDA
jgi:hypothetical protein